MIISFMQAIFKPIFGSFEREDFKKFLRMGLIFAFIIGSYWTMRVLKDSVILTLIPHYNPLPYAKTASIICLLPLVIFYTKLLDKFSREKVFYTLALFYGIALPIFGLLIMSPFVGQAPAEIILARTGFAAYATQILGYIWYVFVESFGSLVVALFWAFSSDITLPESAKKGFPFVVAFGQIGAILGPRYISKIPQWLSLETSAVAVFICSLMVFTMALLMKYFLKVTPPHLLASFQGKNEKEVEKEQEPGFFEGLKLLVSHKYLLGIFAVVSFFEIIVTVFDFHFKNLARTHYVGTDLTAYLGDYAGWVNTITLFCLLLGISNVARLLGVRVALALMPIIIGGALVGFVTFDSLNFLFWLMVGSKAINYALNGPTLKQLYIPTSHDARFKAQAWIETFGSRGAKEVGSLFNMLHGWLGQALHVLVSFYFGIGLVIVWFFSALYLGKTYKHAVDEKKTIC